VVGLDAVAGNTAASASAIAADVEGAFGAAVVAAASATSIWAFCGGAADAGPALTPPEFRRAINSALVPLTFKPWARHCSFNAGTVRPESPAA
jgi:hypothetical protein